LPADLIPQRKKNKPHKSSTALSQLAEHQKVLDPLRAASAVSLKQIETVKNPAFR
jgi:hypothetical protein